MPVRTLFFRVFLIALATHFLTGCSVGQQGGVFGAYDPHESNPSERPNIAPGVFGAYPAPTDSDRSTRPASGVWSLHDRIVSSGQGRYTQRVDSLPDRPRSAAHVPDAVPQPEPRSRRGNARTYEVFGETHHVMQSSQGYRETGIASWYGQKFHGHETSNGEIYDMYAMSAAHRNLPIPTYVRVTNLDNQKQVVVRINDRGPFVGEERIIDLSYAAAYRLGMLSQGTAQVRVESLPPESH